MRPTGPLHIGHYFGALHNWIQLQNDGQYDCFFFVADWHALTTHYEETSSIARNTLEVATDWLSAGLDPEKATVFVQSQVLEHAELHVLLSMVTPLRWLERVPTYKEQIEQLKDRDLGTYGFLGYPLLQSADIVMYGEPKQELFVPVGEDQVPHIELTREIVRTFNSHFGFRVDYERWRSEDEPGLIGALYPGEGNYSRINSARPGAFQQTSAADLKVLRLQMLEEGRVNLLKRIAKQDRKYVRLTDVLREPQVMLTETPRVPGTDGRRMAKSYGNAIWLSDPPDEIQSKARAMMTDPQRVRRSDPGRPEVCPVFAYHRLFSDSATIAAVDRDCRTAAIGCVDCKGKMAEGLVRWVEPILARRRELEAQPKRVWEILDAGSAKARRAAKRTMRRVREAIFDWEQARKPAANAPSARTVATGK